MFGEVAWFTHPTWVVRGGGCMFSSLGWSGDMSGHLPTWCHVTLIGDVVSGTGVIQ